MRTREDFNNKIVKILESFLKNNKDLRFIQALWALGVIDRTAEGEVKDRFYEESEETLCKVLDKYLGDEGKQ